jgi:hypothetical protein
MAMMAWYHLCHLLLARIPFIQLVSKVCNTSTYTYKYNTTLSTVVVDLTRYKTVDISGPFDQPLKLKNTPDLQNRPKAAVFR